MNRLRADELAFRQGLAVSRTAAARAIAAGEILLDETGTAVRKAGQMLPDSTRLTACRREHYVSRGAYKLLGGLQAFHPDIAGKICLDLGSSTGGFTQVLLEQNAKRVYAVDVGTGQLHESLRTDPRIVLKEQTNARSLTRTEIPEPIEFLTGDLSFISLTKVLPAVAPLLAEHFCSILLIKPQFEAGPQAIASGGIVRDEILRLQSVRQVEDFCCSSLGWQQKETVPSPITGGDGNVEYLACFYR